MGKLETKRDALKMVTDAAEIHIQRMTESLSDYGLQEGFKDARRAYIRRLDDAVIEARTIRLDTEAKISQKVSDLNLEDSVDLLHAVEDHIRSLRRTARSNFS